MNLTTGKQLKAWLWHYCDVVCYLIGLLLIDYVIFLCSFKTGLVFLGIEFLIAGGILSFLPKGGGR